MALGLAACAADDEDQDRAAPDSSHLVPTFPAEEERGADDATPAEGAVPVEDGEQGPDAPPDAPDEPNAPANDTAPEGSEPAEREDQTDDTTQADDPAPRTARSAVTDPRGDTSSPLLGSAPDWADLVAGTVERAGTGDVTVTIELAEAPERPRSGTTMNVASFHDLNGDGRIDLELWLNLSEHGWFPSWRDAREGRAAFGDDADLALDVRGATLELVVPARRFGDTTAWRWSLGLEWGRYEWLGSSAAAHDLAPDEGFVAHRG